MESYEVDNQQRPQSIETDVSVLKRKTKDVLTYPF